MTGLKIPMSETEFESEVASVRARLMTDLTPLATFAAAIEVSTRTVERMEERGQIALVRFGRNRFVVLGSVRARMAAQ
jgi:hypothetical protein